MTAQTPTSAVEALRQKYALRLANWESTKGEWAYGHATQCQDILADLTALAASQEAPKAGDVEISPNVFGIACTVAWTELVQALRADGHDVKDKSGPTTRKWIEGIVRDTFAAPTPPASQGDAAPAGDGGDAWHAAVLAACMRIETAHSSADPVATINALEQWWYELGQEHCGCAMTDANRAALAAASAPAVREAVDDEAMREWLAAQPHVYALASMLRGDVRAGEFRRSLVGLLRAFTTIPTPAADGNGGAVDAEAMVMMPEPLWDELDAKAREWKARALQAEAALAAHTKEST